MANSQMSPKLWRHLRLFETWERVQREFGTEPKGWLFPNSRETHIPPQVIKELCNLGLIERGPDAGYNTLYRLTEQGREALANAKAQ